MNPQTSEGLSPTGECMPGSGIEYVGTTENNNIAEAIRSQVIVSVQGGVSLQEQIETPVTLKDEKIQGDSVSLPESEQTALFDGLRATLAMKENCKGAPAIGVIEAALMRNPTMKFNLRQLQKAGAKLIVAEMDGDVAVLADASLNLNVKAQQEALVGLSEADKNAAIETILQPISDQERGNARQWFTKQLSREQDVNGLNWAEALLFAVAHGGTLISQATLDSLAKKDPSVYEDRTWTWYFETL